MRSKTFCHSIVSLIVVACLLIVPVSALGKKGKDHYKRGIQYEQAQQWEKAAQEFTLALASDPSNVDFQLHYRRAVFNASQMFMQQGRALAEQRDYVGAYNAFRQAFGYDPVNQLAVSEMERMLRLQEAKEGVKPAPSAAGDGTSSIDQSGSGGTPSTPGAARAQEPASPSRQDQVRVINYTGDLKGFIRTLAEQLDLNVIFDRQSFAQPRTIDLNLRNVSTARALDYIFLQENLFFQKLDHRTILVADQSRRPQYQQLVVRTFYISNADPDKVKTLIGQALPASVGRPQSIVVSDKDTNSLTVRDTAENVKLIGELLQSIDKDRAEVVMDVNIYEVLHNDLLQFGNQVGQGRFNLGGSPGLAILSEHGTTSSRDRGIDLSKIIGGVPTGAAAALVLPSSLFTAFQSRGNTKLLASTQIHAFNNEESTARIGQRVPVQTAQAYPFGVQTGTTTNSQTGFPSGGFPVINYEPTGLTLNFTPQVFPNLDVQVKMKIESKDVSAADNALTPTFTERTITGTARVQNNRTMMLASVSQDIQSNGRQGLPILGGLPFIGRFFTAPTKENRQVDIVISVTPRVLRAPAVTPRDEEMRQSGTLQSPTTGSIATMMEETEREEKIAAARRIPKEVVLQLPDAQPTYVPTPAAAATNQTSANVSTAAESGAAAPLQFAPVSQNKETAPAQITGAAVTPARVEATSADTAAPPPKTTAQAPAESPAPKPLDVSSALKRVLSPATVVSTTALSPQQDVAVTPTAEQIAPKSEPVASVKSVPATSIVELALVSDKTEMQVGQKQQFAVTVRSDGPLGLAVIMLRFDPSVIKIRNVTAGKLFESAKTAPTLTQSQQDGMLLVSLTPGAGSPVSGDGALLNFEIEAVSAGDSALAFDLSNVHLVSGDGRSVLLQVEPVKLTVKQ